MGRANSYSINNKQEFYFSHHRHISILFQYVYVSSGSGKHHKRSYFIGECFPFFSLISVIGRRPRCYS